MSGWMFIVVVAGFGFAFLSGFSFGQVVGYVKAKQDGRRGR